MISSSREQEKWENKMGICHQRLLFPLHRQTAYQIVNRAGIGLLTLRYEEISCRSITGRAGGRKGEDVHEKERGESRRMVLRAMHPCQASTRRQRCTPEIFLNLNASLSDSHATAVGSPMCLDEIVKGIKMLQQEKRRRGALLYDAGL